MKKTILMFLATGIIFFILGFYVGVYDNPDCLDITESFETMDTAVDWPTEIITNKDSLIIDDIIFNEYSDNKCFFISSKTETDKIYELIRKLEGVDSCVVYEKYTLNVNIGDAFDTMPVLKEIAKTINQVKDVKITKKVTQSTSGNNSPAIYTEDKESIVYFRD